MVPFQSHAEFRYLCTACGCGVTGSRARLRIWCRKTYGFESLHPHELECQKARWREGENVYCTQVYTDTEQVCEKVCHNDVRHNSVFTGSLQQCAALVLRTRNAVHCTEARLLHIALLCRYKQFCIRKPVKTEYNSCILAISHSGILAFHSIISSFHHLFSAGIFHTDLSSHGTSPQNLICEALQMQCVHGRPGACPGWQH